MWGPLAGWCLAVSGLWPPTLTWAPARPGPPMGTRSPVRSYLPPGLLRLRAGGRRREESVRPGAHGSLRGGHCGPGPGKVGCGEGVNQALDPWTHLPPGPPLSRAAGAAGERERGARTVISGERGWRGKEAARTGAQRPGLSLLCRATSSRFWGTPSPSALPGPAPRGSGSAGPRGEDRGRDPRVTRERRPRRRPRGGRPLGVPEGDPVKNRLPGPTFPTPKVSTFSRKRTVFPRVVRGAKCFQNIFKTEHAEGLPGEPCW